MKIKAFIKRAKEEIIEFFFPSCCAVCEQHLVGNEKYICETCFSELPRVRMHNGRMPEVDDLFLGCRIVSQAVSYFRYDRFSKYTEIIKDIKYRNIPEMGEYFAAEFAKELLSVGFFENVDVIVPVPLHKSKFQDRGYNQSMYIAQGVSKISHLPVGEFVVAVKPHRTQTARNAEQRMKNVKGVFDVRADVAGKRILMVDDVITTGATLMECCDMLESAGVQTVKVLSLAMAER